MLGAILNIHKADFKVEWERETKSRYLSHFSPFDQLLIWVSPAFEINEPMDEEWLVKRINKSPKHEKQRRFVRGLIDYCQSPDCPAMLELTEDEAIYLWLLPDLCDISVRHLAYLDPEKVEELNENTPIKKD